jgi:hypothetical protein
MSITDKADAESANAPYGVFTAQIGDEHFSFQEVRFDDRKVTGAQIAEAVGAHPVYDYVVLQQLKTFELETLRPTETADLEKAGRFYVIKGDHTDRFVLDGLSMEWPRDVVTGLIVKRLVGRDACCLSVRTSPTRLSRMTTRFALASPASRPSRRAK